MRYRILLVSVENVCPVLLTQSFDHITLASDAIKLYKRENFVELVDRMGNVIAYTLGNRIKVQICLESK
jgi:hypothetical protein